MTLLEYLVRHRITQLSFATQLGVSQAAVSRYCHGRLPASSHLIKIIKITGGAVMPEDFPAPPHVANALTRSNADQAAEVPA